MHKLGIIGYGGMANWHHENAARVDGLEVVAAHDIDPERLVLAREKGLRTHETLESFLADDGFDMVLVATPNNFHRDLSIAAMKAGKNVICEKPVAMNSRELTEMMETAKQENVLFTIHQNRRWDKDFQIVRKSIEDGLIGKPYVLESRVHGANVFFFGWRLFQVAGGGMLLDWGVHLIDQFLYLIPEKVVEVYAQLIQVKTQEVDDYCKVLLKFESGITAVAEVGTCCFHQLPRWFVGGDSGTLVINNWDCEGSIMRANKESDDWEPVIVQTSAGPTRTMAPRPKETLEELALPEVNPNWVDYYRNVIAAIDGKEELIVKPEQAMRVLKVIEAAFASSAGSGSVAVDI